MNQEYILENVIKEFPERWKKRKLLIGFDGFIDEIIHVIDQRQDRHNYTRIRTITGFSERIAEAAGLSSNIELVPTEIKLGGNGPIMANALKYQDYDITYMGCLGANEIHPLFHNFTSGLKEVYTLADPGHTDALEFNDGKIMLGKLTALEDVNWQRLLSKVPEEVLQEIVYSVALIAINNWTMLPGLTSIMAGFNRILEKMTVAPVIFIDLADPQKRTREDIADVLKNISALEANTRVILGLNKRESATIAEVLEIKEELITARAAAIRRELDLSAVVIHPLDGAAVATHDTTEWVTGPYTPNPNITTGAGDNFNAGFCNGWLCGMSTVECLLLGVSSSGFYVRNGYPPNRQELVNFMQSWLEKKF
jgi:sugar/nucleoside kinase (ribokinase family)